MTTSTANDPTKYYQRAAAGSIAGFTSRMLTAPLDVVKIRLQVQVESLSSQPAKYHGSMHALKTIVREEGVLALWKGNLSAECLWVSFVALQFFAYEPCRRVSDSLQRNLNFHPSLSPLMAGGGAAFFATTLSYPFDFLRTLFAAQAEPKEYKSFAQALQLARKSGGPFCFLRGITPGLLAIVPQGAISFGVYEALRENLAAKASTAKSLDSFTERRKQREREREGESEGNVDLNSNCDNLSAISTKREENNKNNLHLPPALADFLAGCVAGATAKFFTLPLDVAKKRLQIQSVRGGPGGDQRLLYNGMTHVWRKIWQAEGVAGLCRGGVPAVAKSTISSGIIFCMYELCIKRIVQ